MLPPPAPDAAASVYYNDQQLGWFLAPLTSGNYPPQLWRCVGGVLPAFSAQQAGALTRSGRGILDFVGINCYTARCAARLCVCK